MGRPVPPLHREECPRCGSELAYLPLGRMCLFHGYVWAQQFAALIRCSPIALDRALGDKLREDYVRAHV